MLFCWVGKMYSDWTVANWDVTIDYQYFFTSMYGLTVRLLYLIIFYLVIGPLPVLLCFLCKYDNVIIVWHCCFVILKLNCLSRIIRPCGFTSVMNNGWVRCVFHTDLAFKAGDIILVLILYSEAYNLAVVPNQI
jgi:hypothetical protein